VPSRLWRMRSGRPRSRHRSRRQNRLDPRLRARPARRRASHPDPLTNTTTAESVAGDLGRPPGSCGPQHRGSHRTHNLTDYERTRELPAGSGSRLASSWSAVSTARCASTRWTCPSRAAPSGWAARAHSTTVSPAAVRARQPEAVAPCPWMETAGRGPGTCSAIQVNSRAEPRLSLLIEQWRSGPRSEARSRLRGCRGGCRQPLPASAPAWSFQWGAGRWVGTGLGRSHRAAHL